MSSASASPVQGVDPHEQKKELKTQEKRSKLTTLEAFLDLQFSSWYCAQYPKSGDREINNLKKNFPTLLPMQLKDITASVVERRRAEMLKENLSNSTINRRFTTLKSVMIRAVDWDIIEKHDLRKVKMLREDNTLVRYLSFEEEEALKRAMQARNYRIKKDRENCNKHPSERGYPLLPDLSNRTYADHIEPLVVVAMNTGMRKGELLNLTWADVNFERDFVTVKAARAKKR